MCGMWEMCKMGIWLVLVVVMGSLGGCRKDVYADIRIGVSADVTEQATTHLFTFTVRSEVKLPAGEKIYCRYDWEGDGVWDTPFTEDLQIHHRYYAPGEYLLKTEFLTRSGQSQSDSLGIKVTQGYSAPRANFSLHPLSGHFKTEFLFDASLTRDDEDSLETLLFRWDIFNDGEFETPWQSEPVTNHVFPAKGKYPVKLEVRDPSLRFASVTHWVEVTHIDSLIIPLLTISPAEGSVADTFWFDASASYHATDAERAFSYSWKFTHEAPTLASPDSAVIRRIFERPGPLSVRVILTDQYGLTQSLEKEFYVSMGNRPPTAFFEYPSRWGNVQTQFYFRAWGSKDDQQGGSELDKRWDFDGDGIWDTPYSKDMEANHQYAVAGTYHPTLEVTDKQGLSDQFSLEVEISPYENPTGYLMDARDAKLYATVKIGNDWWMAENLDWRPDTTKTEMRMIHRCYGEERSNCDQYGGLYLGQYVEYYLESGRNVCPDGWHIPDKREMEALSAQLPASNSKEALLPGGKLDFNALYTGSGSYFYRYDPFRPDRVIDTVWTYRDLGKAGYATSLAYKGVNQVLNLQYSTESPEAWVFWYPAEFHYYPIRCVKD